MNVAGIVMCAGLCATGCMRDENSRLTLGYEAEGNGIVTLAAVSDNTSMVETDQRSVSGLDRSGWTQRVVLVPNDGVYSYPNLTRTEPLYDDSTAGARGEFPDALQALETEHDLGSEVAETFAWPGWVVYDIVMAIPRAIDGVQVNPVEGYARSARSETWEGSDAPPASQAVPMELDDSDGGGSDG